MDGSKRFEGLTVITVIFQIICTIILVVGLFAIFGDQASDGPLSQAGQGIRIVVGSVLAFQALTFLVFSGGIHVLIGIDQSTRATGERVEAVLARLKNDHSDSSGSSVVPETVARNVPAFRHCAKCGASNASGNAFCTSCGASLASDRA